jgi:hypothetical protein
MRLRSGLGAAFLLITLAGASQVSNQSVAAETTSNHLQSLAARQDLFDKVCYAKADGSISRSERQKILADAKKTLSPNEYVKFKTSLDRFSPPKKPAPSQLAKKSKKGSSGQMAKKSKKPSSSQLANKPASPPQQDPQPAATESDLVLPAGAALPDPMAPPTFFR